MIRVLIAYATPKEGAQMKKFVEESLKNFDYEIIMKKALEKRFDELLIEIEQKRRAHEKVDIGLFSKETHDHKKIPRVRFEYQLGGWVLMDLSRRILLTRRGEEVYAGDLLDRNFKNTAETAQKEIVGMGRGGEFEPKLPHYFKLRRSEPNDIGFGLPHHVSSRFRNRQ